MKMEREVTIWSLIGGDDDEKTKSKKSKVLYSICTNFTKNIEVAVGRFFVFQ